ncbi:ABC transporter permease [Streptomyces acidiscabies]|uniref:Transport permease protein n=2 Tax=Streptomyces acidiscabies TaxID=42234 RepID=A0AAP6EKA7_9ACTN|nr:ABC transporter permease [Streptomyces acidiscabies]MBP5938568.1 ABC transporter permease [Streptomyces sp. LBUM 1476]MBZ3909662.1 ABC transporter permease [Streptomyces acidiscabies]MDX2965376.1 ABC transporter permease [Streptomyces acidiscabies]MDX3024555.1 ABC transporter permease [Streptomyces acidiscabies]MDX3795210.1 ABC transporter permease [Streptomyces acidiscabies]
MSGVATTTPGGRMKALARAEFTLLGRSRSTLVTAVLVPLMLPFSLKAFTDDEMLKETGLDIGQVLLPAGIGFSLLFGVYSVLAGTFTVRREELVLKRLRTGELRDGEILVGSALPMVATGIVQSLVLVAGCTVLLDMDAPSAPLLAVLGVVLGIAVCAALAAVTSGVTRSAESAQVTPMPFLFLSMICSGVAVPLEVFPDRAASVMELLPLSPAITLIRGAWTGELSAYDALGAVLTGLAWIVLAVFAVKRWFKWEPRR